MGIFDFLFKKKPNSHPREQHGQVEVKTVEHLKADPPREWQLKQAAKLGIEVVEGLTCTQLQKVIDKAEFNKPPTHQQLKKAKLLGVNVAADSKQTYGQIALLLEEAASNQPAKPEQVELCNSVGIQVPSNMTVGMADKLVAEAKSNPKYRTRFEEIDREQQQKYLAEEDRELRERYGDKFIDEFSRWEKISSESGSQYLMIYRKGKGIAVEVVEFDVTAEMVEGKSPYIKLALLLPKKASFEKGCYSLEWENEAEVRSSNVLYIQKLEKALTNCEVMLGQESKDFVEYKKVIEKATAYAKKFESS